MGRKVSADTSGTRKLRPALTPEARENQMISLAMDLAEKQLMEGTASPLVVSHFLKLGATRERLEREKTECETELLKAKKESLDAAKRCDELYEKALEAMRKYSGNGGGE